MGLMMVLETVAVELQATMEEETGVTGVTMAATEAEVAVDVEADKDTN